MKDCSIVTATYELSDGLKGTIGIVGPKRMDYPKVMKTLETLMQQLNAIFPKVPELEKKEAGEDVLEADQKDPVET